MTWITNAVAHLRTVWSYQHEPEYAHRLAILYWNLLLAGMALVVGGFILYGVLKFFSAAGSTDARVFLSRGDGAALNRAELQATIEGFSARKSRYEFLKKNPPNTADPSR